MRRRDLFLAASLAVAAKGAYGQPGAAPDLMRTWLERWLVAFNDADLAVYKAFVARTAPAMLAYVDDDLSVRETTGGLDLLAVETATADSITVIVKDRAWDRRSRVTLTASGEQRLDDITFTGAAVKATIPRLEQAAAIRAARDKIRLEGAAGRFSGASLVAAGRQVLLSAAQGLADEAAQTPNQPNTRFCIGSMGKMFTAVAVMQEVEAGRIQLDAPVRAYLPDYPNPIVAERVTISHLLTHTGGTGDIFGPSYDGRVGASAEPAELVRLYGERPPQFEPGSRWGYSNYGFVLLGRILERVDERPYAALLDAKILGPCAMTATSLDAEHAGSTARAYAGARATGLKALPAYVGLPAGGAYSTVEDMHAFALALQVGRLVRPETLKAMAEPRVAAGSGHWGLGLAIRERNGLRYYGHGGAAPGVTGDLAIFPAFTTITLCNRGHPAATCLADFIGVRLPIEALGASHSPKVGDRVR